LPHIELRWRRLDGRAAAGFDLASEGTTHPVVLLHWTETPRSVDERLSWRLVEAVATALCDTARLSFLSDELIPTDGRGLRGALQRLGGGDAAAWRGPADTAHRPIHGLNESTLVSTTSADTARHAFTIGSWHLATAQVLLLSDPASPPRVPDALLRRCALEKNWDELAPELAACGIQAVATQGHDGACLGWVMLDEGIETRLEEALARNAALGGLGWRTGAQMKADADADAD
jgi:hypothetical protein